MAEEKKLSPSDPMIKSLDNKEETIFRRAKKRGRTLRITKKGS
jgi:hypothetical protein